MEKFELKQLRDLPIEGVAERLGLQVSRHKCLCPFHDDHRASLTFKNNKFKCWSCGESGDSISFVMKVLGKDFLDACRWLADGKLDSSFKIQVSSYLNAKGVASDKRERSGKPETRNLKPFDASRYEKFFARPWLLPEARKFLFEERRIDPRVVRWCRVTSWKDRNGTPWLQIPYYDREGKLTGIQNRNLVSRFKMQDSGDLQPETRNLKPEAPRFRFPMGSRCGIYNLPVVNMLHYGEALFIAEGCSDCWSLLSAGHKAIAIPSATLLTRKNVEMLSTLHSGLSTQFHMYPDNDTPGERLFLQLQKVLPNLVRHQLPPGCKDYSDYYLIHNA